MNLCVLCQATIEHPLSVSFIFSFQPLKQEVVCTDCLKQFEQLEHIATCSGCRRPQRERAWCKDCLKWASLYETLPPNHKALFAYNESAREFMRRFKFQGDVVLGKVFKDVLSKHLHPYLETHTIVPIPLSQQGKRLRGFNQVEVLLKSAGIPYEKRLLHVGAEKKQSSKTKEERMLTQPPFKQNPNIQKVPKQKILLIDDVYTTGRTMYHARACLEPLAQTETFSLFR